MEGKHLPNRRTTRLTNYDYSSEDLYFITICSEGFKSTFGDIINQKIKLSILGRIVNDVWNNLTSRFNNIVLHEFVIMPNHIHGIIEIKNHGECTLGEIIGAFKSLTTLKYIKVIKQNNLTPFDRRVWQKNYFEHIIRGSKSHEKIAAYIIENPIYWDDDRYYIK